ncbi:FLNA [Mytilus edulis]|uniref:FLNA n=1 Tax=Mytilus edulis TaxID=6550 RepID=A0A8S3R4J4_MYTED|nr:FLNA [Mytilus edulis]
MHILENVLMIIRYERLLMYLSGNEDIVNGNLKLILGLTWHLVMRYQISTRKTKSPPKQLMMNWFRVSIPGVRVNNFTTDWNDGIALHALIDNLKPGISPQVENCRDAMVLAKDHLNIPRVISPEDFANPALDELSAMTYLSYFVKPNSPGYYATLNWVCKQLKTTTISNLTTDWNDGYNLCAIVASQGGHIEGWPNLDRKDHVSNCQKAIDGGKDLGVEPLLTAEEIADPKVDHLSLMTYISRFQHLVPKKKDEEKIGIKADLNNIRTGVQALITLLYHEKDLKKDFLQVDIAGPSSEQINCDTAWKEKYAECKFVPKEAGEYNVNITYNNKKLVGCPLVFTVKQDLSTVRFITPTESRCRVGSQNSLQKDRRPCFIKRKNVFKTDWTKPGKAIKRKRSNDDVSEQTNKYEVTRTRGFQPYWKNDRLWLQFNDKSSLMFCNNFSIGTSKLN